MPSPNTYVIYGHGSFDSTSISAPARLPAGATLYFATGHIREIGDDKMVGTANSVLMSCYYRDLGVTHTHWTADPEITSLFYERIDTPGQTVPDYILGDTQGLWQPALQEYRSREAMLLMRPKGSQVRLSAILNSLNWRNRHPMVYFVWCGCRAMDLGQTPAKSQKFRERRDKIVLDL